MIIDIREIPVYYINLKSNKDRKKTIEDMFNDYGFKNIIRFEGIVSGHPTIGCAMSHKAILDQIINEGVQAPFIILEDDASILNEFNPEIFVPDDSDAMYLGLSPFARIWNYTVSDMVAKKVNDDTYRIYNQLAAHAILYTNIDYVKFLSKAIPTAIEVSGHQDIVRASTMKFFNIYARNKPIFFQNDQDMRVDLLTSRSLSMMNLVPPNATNLGFACSCHRHR
jgi:GR25 family glycosyltransferase involved in LPS biosynthesis